MMGRAVQKKTLIALFCCLSTDAVAASPAGICPTGADGNWTITAVRSDPIYALTDQEAHAYVGKKVFVSERRVVYAGKQCDVAKKTVRYSVGELTDEPGFPYAVGYDCKDKNIFVPGFTIGKSCDLIHSGLDGWTFDLRRVKAK